jgi:hypothetical protein
MLNLTILMELIQHCMFTSVIPINMGFWEIRDLATRNNVDIFQSLVDATNSHGSNDTCTDLSVNRATAPSHFQIQTPATTILADFVTRKKRSHILNIDVM